MKTILTLTDDTLNAGHAAAEALRLAGMLHTNLLYANSYTPVPLIGYGEVVPMVAEEDWLLQKERLQKLKHQALRLQEEGRKLPEGNRCPKVRYVRQAGDLATMVRSLCQAHQVLMIAMGQSAEGPATHFFFGSETRQVIEAAERPVLIVPLSASIGRLKKVTFATDFSREDLFVLKSLTRLLRHLGAEISVIHIHSGQEKEQLKADEALFRAGASRLRYPLLTYQTVRGQDPAARLQRLCARQKTDLLVMGHHQHHFFGRLTHHSQARTVISGQALPLLIFPITA